MTGQQHQPVLLADAIHGLFIQPNGTYVDGTYGRGGHATAILEKLSEHGTLLLIDKDPEAIAHAKKLFGEDGRVIICHGSFAEIKSIVSDKKLAGCVDGILLDLGVSSPQLDTAERGFSFAKEGPLDMRMDTSKGESAAEWLSHVSEKELVTVLKEFGEEKFARRIATAIIKARTERTIATTKELADIVVEAIPFREKHKHPATRTFQAIRIAVNNELTDLETFLDGALDVMKVGGRLAIISFHSLEDRIVKRFFKKEHRGGEFPKGLPVKADAFHPRLKIVGRAIRPAGQEVNDNRRARSAVLRIAEKVA